MAITTKKMRLRTSKRNNKPKTPKRKNNKSYTKKRNSAIKAKKNSRRVRKQKGGEIISDKNLLTNIKADLYDENEIDIVENKKTLSLDLILMLTTCMFYINPNFYELVQLKDIDSIKEQYSTNNTKIFDLFNSYIDFLKTKIEKKVIDIINLNIYINTKNSFNYTNFRKVRQYDTEFITNLLFNEVMKNLLDKKINFKLTINDNLIIIPFTQPLNIEEITNFINEMPDDFHFKTLLEKKLKELDIIGFGFGSILPNNTANPHQYTNE